MSSFGRSKGGGRRSATREQTPLLAVFTTVTSSHSALVADVSASGVRLRGEDLPKRGEVLELRIESVHAFGIVMWSDRGECGIAFDEPLRAADIALLRHGVTTMDRLPPQIKGAFEDWLSGFAR